MYPNLKGGEGIRRSLLMESDELITYYYHDARTLYELFIRGLRESSEFYITSLGCWRDAKGVTLGFIWDLFSPTDNGPCLGSRKVNQPYEWQSYQEVSTPTHTCAFPGCLVLAYVKLKSMIGDDKGQEGVKLYLTWIRMVFLFTECFSTAQKVKL